MDFRPSAAEGLRVAETSLAGYAYASNFGWVNFGSGNPTNGHTHGNSTSTDFGVNVSEDGFLTGYAYAANIGWIQYSTAHGSPKLDLLTGKFTGFAYAANLGWIALESNFSSLTTASISRPDSDSDGIPDAWELRYFGNLTTANHVTDRDGDGASDLSEFKAGTHPLQAASVLRIVSYQQSANRTEAILTFTTSPHRLYRVEHDEDLSGLWTNSPLGQFTPAGPLMTAHVNGLAPVPRRYFRVVAVLPIPSSP